MSPQIISAEQARWARRILSLSQRKLSDESEKSLSYIKQFETGRFNPGTEFQQGLRSFFESKGVDFEEFGETLPDPQEPARAGKSVKTRRPCFYAAQGLDEDDLNELLTIIDDSLERVAPLVLTKINRGLLGGQSQESEDITRTLFSELALIGYAYATVAGRFQLQPKVLSGEPKTQKDVLADFLARAIHEEPSDSDDEEEAA